MKHQRLGRGFTLIELLVVILILAILAALIVPRVVMRQGEAKRAKAAADIATLSGLLQAYKLDTDHFPTTDEGLQALRVAPADVTNWHGPYTTRPIPTDPWQSEYVYEYPGASGDDSYVLISYGADGAPGGEGDNMDITEGVDEN